MSNSVCKIQTKHKIQRLSPQWWCFSAEQSVIMELFKQCVLIILFILSYLVVFEVLLIYQGGMT